MFFEGESGKTWVFAHQSSFSAQLDDIVYKKMYDTKKNDIAISPKVSFKKGDTLTFAGSSGIGNPHLHLEVRTADNKGLSPCGQGALCLDTIAPQIFAAAVTYKDEVSFTSAEALDKGCIETPIKNTFENDAPVHISFKIADYSREPKENPMSVRRVEVFRYDEKMFSKIQDTIPFSKQLRIRDELLWAEEADTAGDWHFVNVPFPPQSEYRIEVEDYAGNVTTKKISIRSRCKGNTDFAKQNFQKTPLITYLSRPALDLSRCDSSYTFSVRDKDGNTLSANLCKAFPHKLTFLGKVAETFPAATKIVYSKGDFENTIYMTTLRKGVASATWTVKDEDFEISQKVTGLAVKTNEGTGVLAFTRNVTDSLNFYEFHPKGLQFTGNWEVCIDAHTAPAPLYWLDEPQLVHLQQAEFRQEALREHERAPRHRLHRQPGAPHARIPLLGQHHHRRATPAGAQDSRKLQVRRHPKRQLHHGQVRQELDSRRIRFRTARDYPGRRQAPRRGRKDYNPDSRRREAQGLLHHHHPGHVAARVRSG